MRKIVLTFVALLLAGGPSPANAQWLVSPGLVAVDPVMEREMGRELNLPRLVGAPDVQRVDLPGAGVDGRPAPRWLRWGLIGGAVGGLTFMALGRLSIDGEPDPPLQDAAEGAVFGFAITAATIGLWDLVCAPGSKSRRAGLCSR